MPGIQLPYTHPASVNARRQIGGAAVADQHTMQGVTADQANFSRAQVQQDDAQNRDSLTGLVSALKTSLHPGGASASSAGAGATGVGPWTPSTAAPAVAPVDTSGAEAAAFARAKDKVGQTASGALTGLRSALGGRGMLGSGAESRGTASVINRGQGELGDVAREQAIDASGLAERTATTNFQGGITQRGQDMSAGIAARGQDMSAADAFANRQQDAAAQEDHTLASILGLWSAFSGKSAGTRY